MDTVDFADAKALILFDEAGIIISAPISRESKKKGYYRVKE